MIPAKELRDKLTTTLLEEVNTYLKDKVEPKAAFAAKCGKANYSFVIHSNNCGTNYLDTFISTLQGLGYTTSYTTVSSSLYQVTIGW